MSNWKITDGNTYVAKSGDDILGDGSPANPYKTGQRAVDAPRNYAPTNKIVYGTGAYEENVQVTADWEFHADGEVLMDGTAVGGTGFVAMGAYQVRFFNISFLNFDYHIKPLLFSGDSYAYKCNFTNGGIGVAGQGGYFNLKGCLLVNSPVNLTTATIFAKNTFINSTVIVTGSFGTLRDCYFDPTSTFTGTPTIEDFNNFRNGYLFTGTHDINADPQFNLKTLDDYSIPANSPNAISGSDQKEIGAREVSLSYNGLSPEFTVAGGATYTNVQLDANNHFIISPGNTQGTVLSADIDLGVKKSLGVMKLFANQNLINNVVDYGNTGLELPNRLTYRMKYADVQAGLITAPFVELEWGKIPTVDDIGVGNGDPAFNPLSVSTITARWIIMEITLRNDGLGG